MIILIIVGQYLIRRYNKKEGGGLMKQCSKCKEWKDESEYHKNKLGKDGVLSQCKSCKQKYYIENNEQIKLREKQYYEAHKEQNKLKDVEYYIKNKDLAQLSLMMILKHLKN